MKIKKIKRFLKCILNHSLKIIINIYIFMLYCFFPKYLLNKFLIIMYRWLFYTKGEYFIYKKEADGFLAFSISEEKNDPFREFDDYPIKEYKIEMKRLKIFLYEKTLLYKYKEINLANISEELKEKKDLITEILFSNNKLRSMFNQIFKQSFSCFNFSYGKYICYWNLQVIFNKLLIKGYLWKDEEEKWGFTKRGLNIISNESEYIDIFSIFEKIKSITTVD